MNETLKPIWIRSEVTVEFGPLNLSLPEFMVNPQLSQHFHQFCQRVKELGYNSILIGSRNGIFSSNKDLIVSDLNVLHQVLKVYQLKLIIKPQLSFEVKKFIQSSLEDDYRNYLIQSINASLKSFKPDYWFWEANLNEQCYLRTSKSFNATSYERILSEVKLFEEILENENVPLIFYLPTSTLDSAKKHSSWLLKLLIDVDKKTILSFSSVSNQPWQDHICFHPFFETLRKEGNFSYTPLLPIFNLGSVQQGEGLWPIFNFDIIENFMMRYSTGHFLGGISLSNYLPSKGSILDCNLLVANKSMYEGKSTINMLEEWFEANWPEIELGEILGEMTKWRSIALNLSNMRFLNENREIISNEESRLMGESLLSEIKCQQLRLSRSKAFKVRSKIGISLFDYFTYFICDARRIIEDFLVCYNHSCPDALLGKNEPQESFWTTSRKSGKASVFLSQPQKGSGMMEQIFCHTRVY